MQDDFFSGNNIKYTKYRSSCVVNMWRQNKVSLDSISTLKTGLKKRSFWMGKCMLCVSNHFNFIILSILLRKKASVYIFVCWMERHHIKVNFLKLQSGIFPLCRHLCSKSAIAGICGIINFARVVLQHPQHGTARIITMFEESVQLSVTVLCTVWILALRITEYSFLKVWTT